MKWLILLILLIPLSSALNISVDYPDKISPNIETKFSIKINDPSGEFYDVKIDIIQNDKRISKILDSGKLKSSMYYVNDVLQEENDFYVAVNGAKIGDAAVIFKIRNANGRVYTFDDYGIFVLEELTDNIGAQKKFEPKEEKQSDVQITQINADEIKKEVEAAIVVPEKEQIGTKPLSLNPKTIKTDENFEKDKAGIGKYLFLIFTLILLTLYITKPTKKKNEFRY